MRNFTKRGENSTAFVFPFLFAGAQAYELDTKFKKEDQYTLLLHRKPATPNTRQQLTIDQQINSRAADAPGEAPWQSTLMTLNLNLALYWQQSFSLVPVHCHDIPASRVLVRSSDMYPLT